MANRHLQRDEAAIAVAEHDDILAVGAVIYRSGHSISHGGKTAADGLRFAKSWQFRNDHPK